MPDVDEDELTRDKVKKAANQILLAQVCQRLVRANHTLWVEKCLMR